MSNAIIGFLVAFCVSAIIAPFIIKLFRKIKNGQPILSYVELHQTKSGTPTMGGVIFVVGTVAGFLTLVGQNMRLGGIALSAMLGYGLLGFLDDFLKVKYAKNDGLKPYQKIIGQVGVAFLIAVYVYFSPYVGSEIILPFSNFNMLDLSWFIVPFVVFIFIATTNAVNLTDGLDGLAGSVSFVYLIGFSAVFYKYINHLKEMGESLLVINELTSLLYLCLIVSGAVLAFLMFNSHPAKVFMGDTGSLALGGFIASVAVFSKMTLYLPFIGFLFVATAFSSMIQVAYYKKTKKRIFLMAPLHHHFEKKGYFETKIVANYIIATIILSIFMFLFA